MQCRRLYSLYRRIAGLALALTALSACAQVRPIEGRVLEQGIDAPIAETILVALWKGDGFHGTICFHVESTISDERGHYRIAPPEITSPHRNLLGQEVYVIAHKAGYERAKESPRGIKYLLRFDGDPSERLRYLKTLNLAVSCGAAGDSKKNLLPLQRAMYEEAKSLVSTNEDKKILETLLWSVEHLEYGAEEAQRRHLRRLEGKK